MKSIVLFIGLIVAGFSYGQFTNNCPFYTSVGTTTSGSSGIGPPGCNNFPGMVATGPPVAWTGLSCTGFITSTIVGGPVSCMTLTYSSVNTNDFGTITTDTGGNLTLSANNAAVNGNVLGPYNCSGSFGTVELTVCSDIPFNSVTLTNTGCTSGWVINCSDQSGCSGTGGNAGGNGTATICNTTLDLNTLVTGDPGGTWTETTIPASGQFNTGTGVFDANGLANGVYTFEYAVTGCATTTATMTVTVDCACNIDLFQANIGLCEGLTDTYTMSGDVTFSQPPVGGTMIVEVNNGSTTYDTIINPPFVSPQTWSISGIPSDGAGSTITVFFSNDPGCSSTINYNAPPSCACDADIGTFSTNITGQSTNNYVLCFGDQISLTSNNDWTGPGEMFNPPGPPYTPGVSWLIYSCPPTVALVPDPFDNVPDDPCFLGLVSDTDLIDLNDLFWINAYPPGTFTDNIIYWVPITMYSQSNGTYSFVNGATLPCYELGAPYAVQYLPDFTSSFTDDCLAGTADITVNGALAAIDGSNFTASNLLPATASFVNTTALDGGVIQISGLQGGDMWSFDVTDANGCTYNVSGGPFPPLEDPGFNYPQTSWCTSEGPMGPNITGVGGGTFASTPAGLSINAGSGVITPGTSTPGTYNVTYTTPGACFDDSTIVVNIAATPSVNPIPNQTICNGANFTDIIFTGSAGSTFDWTNDNTNIGLAASGTGDILAFAGTAGGAQEVANIIVTPTAGSCVGPTETFTLTVDPTEDATFSYPAPGAWCTSDVVQAANVTGTGGGTFAAVPVGLTLNPATSDITPASSTPGVYDVTYTTPGPCTATSTVQVTINEVPIADPVANQTVCVGTNFTTVNFTSATAGTTFDWTNDNVGIGLVSNGTGDIAAFAGATTGGSITGNITVTPSTADCIGTPINFTLNVDDLDDATFSYMPGLTYCQTAADPVTNITGLTGGTFSFTVASGGPNLSINPATGDVVLMTSDLGTYDITYNTTGAVGSLCPNTQTLTLAITAGPIADFTLDIYCQNDADPLPTYINGGSGGTFSSAPGGLVIDPNSGLVDLGASTPGTYTVTNDINVAGCPLATYNDDITINEVPDATISGSANICSGDPFPDLTIDITSGAPNWDITYNVDGTPTTVNAAATPYTIAGAGVGTYDLVSITDGNGCSQLIAGQAIVGLFQTPTVDPLLDQDVCEGDNLLIQTFSSTPPGATFDWTNTTGTDVGFGLNGVGDIGSFTGTNGTSSPIPVNVDVVPTSADGCVGPVETFIVTVNPLPQVSFTGGAIGCEPLTVEFTNTTTPPGATCLWNFGNGNMANGCTVVSNSYNAGTYDVTLTVTTAEGCTDNVTYPDFVQVEPRPEAQFTFSPQEIEVTEPIVEFSNNSTNASTYLWDFGDGSSSSFVESPAHLFPSEPGEYTVELIAFDANGWCPDTTVQIIVVDDIIIFYVPNIITPDGDLFNEVFQPVFTSGYDKYDYHLTIFNRWGEIVFESYNADKGWNGHYGDGGLVQDGVYVWQIDFAETMSDRRHTHRGHVTVLK